MFMKWLFPGLYAFSFAPDKGGGGGGKTKQDETPEKEEENETDADKKSDEEDDGDGEDETDAEKKLKADLAETKAKLARANKEAAERRKKLEALEKADDDKKKADLSETDRLKAEKEAAETKAADAEKTNRTLRMERNFDKVVRTEKIVFANEKAAEDAFTLLDLAEIEDDGEGMKEQVMALLKERPYLRSTSEAPETDATKKGKGDGVQLTEEIMKKKRREYPSI